MQSFHVSMFYVQKNDNRLILGFFCQAVPILFPVLHSRKDIVFRSRCFNLPLVLFCFPQFMALRYHWCPALLLFTLQ